MPLNSEDYYVNEQGYRVFTEKYHLKRGYCCKNGCKHCPYGYDKKNRSYCETKKIKTKLEIMRKQIIQKLSGFILIVTIFSCAPMNVRTDYDKSVNFTAFKSYNYYQKGLDELKMNQFDKDRLVRAIDAEMAARGVQKSETPSLLINLETATKERVNINSNVGVGFGGYGWGMGWNQPVSVNRVTLGSIVMDIVDVQKNKLVWQGIGNGLNVSREKKREILIGKAIKHLMKDFPVKVKENKK